MSKRYRNQKMCDRFTFCQHHKNSDVISYKNIESQPFYCYIICSDNYLCAAQPEIQYRKPNTQLYIYLCKIPAHSYVHQQQRGGRWVKVGTQVLRKDIITIIVVGTKPYTVKVALSCQHNNLGNKLGFVRQNAKLNNTSATSCA